MFRGVSTSSVFASCYLGIFIAFVSLAALPVTVFAAVSCNPQGYASVIGTEIVATSCIPEGMNDNTAIYYKYRDYSCVNGVVTLTSTGNEVLNSPNGILNPILGIYFRSFRNKEGSYIFQVASAYHGLIDGKDMDNYPTGHVYTDVFTEMFDQSLTAPNCKGADFDRPDMESCAGSTVNKGTGRLSHSQKVFSTTSSQALALKVSLNYRSQNFAPSTIGNGWSHSYEMLLQSGVRNSKIFWQNGKRRVYESYNTGYVAPKGDYSSLVKNADGSYTLTEKNGLVRHFDSAGVATSIVDRNGNTLIFGYTAAQLTTVTDPNGRIANFAYDGNGKLATITDPNGNVYTLVYSGAQLTAVNNPDSTHWDYTYGANGLLATKSDPASNVITYNYNTDNRLDQTTDPVGKGRLFALGGGGTSPAQAGKIPDPYPVSRRLPWEFTATEKDGNNWTYTFDTLTQRIQSKTDPLGNTTSYTYDYAGNMLTKTEPGIGTTSYTYDSQGNVLSVTDPLNQTTTFTYNAFGQILTVDGAPGSYAFSYDVAGNLLSVTNPAGEVTQYGYDAAGNLTSVTDPLGHASTLVYDAGNSLTSITFATGAVTQFTHDANGNMLSATNALGKITGFGYDSRNRMTTVTDPLGNVTTLTYDGNGHPATQVDANGKVTAYQYNYVGQLTQIQDALSHLTAFSYGEAGCPSCSGVDELNSVTDAKGQQTTYSYDQIGRLLTETDPLGQTVTYGYGATRNPTSITAADATSVSYTYDALQRLTQKTYPDASTATYGYDARGNLVSAANAAVSYTLGYDAANRLTSVTDSRGYQIAYQYDAAGNRTSMTLQPGTPQEQTFTYGYDAGNRPTSIASPAGTFGFGYDVLNRRTSLSYPNGVNAGYSYQPDAGWLAGIDYPELTLAIAYPQYDKVGNRTARSEDGTTTDYAYDATYQLTQAKTGVLEENFTYDAVGNRESGPTVKDTPAASYDHDAANRMTHGRKYDYAYDARGNQTDRFLNAAHSKYWHFTWDAENHLTGAELINGTTTLRTLSFKYGPFGRRVEKQVSQVGATVTTRYVYDREDIVLQIEDDGTTTTTTTYVHGPGIDEPLAQVVGGQSYYYHADGLGSIVAISDSAQNLVARYSYDAFGMVSSTAPEFVNSYAYTGREWDREIGLYYYRARYFDPMEGRFVGTDPLHFFGGGVNLYTYVQNQPINFFDPFGLCRQKGESRTACADRVAKEVLGDKLDLVDSFGYWGLGAWTVSTAIGNEALTRSVDKAAAEALKNANIAGARTEGDIVAKIAASERAGKAAARITSMRAGLATVSKVSGVLGLAATGTSAVMRGLGYYFGDCSEVCSDCN